METENTLSILLIEDNPGDARLIEEFLSDNRFEGIDVKHADSLASAREQLTTGHFDCILLDLNLPDGQGPDLFETVRAQVPDIAIVALTGLTDEQVALTLLRKGLQHYLNKDEISAVLLHRTIRYAVERNHIHQQLQKSEARFRSLIEKNVDGMLIVDKDGIILFLNPSIEKFFQLSTDELLGTQFGFPVLTDESTEIDIVRKDGMIINAEMRAVEIDWMGSEAVLVSIRDITRRKQIEMERENLIAELETAIAEIKTLGGLLPICSYCKKIRDDKGYWRQIESYIQDHSDAEFSHSICRECAEKYYPDMDLYDE